jgi:uncharacterized protein with NRDE domain
MCLILLAWQTHPNYPLVVAANRDEFFARPTAPAAFWADAPHILAGRDLQGGGTWLGINRQGRFAALTNYREGGIQRPGAPSRGVLVADFLADESELASEAEGYLAALAVRATDFNGFNLLVGDSRQMAYYANRNSSPQHLLPGIYGLSNHLLDTPWPKLASAKLAFAEALNALPNFESFFELLADQEIVADERLPNTGVALEWERQLSAIFVSSPTYGTRACTVLTVRKDGDTTLTERSFGHKATQIGEVCERFQVPC